MKKIVTYCFFAIEAVLFCIFVSMDVMSIPHSNYVKFAAIALVGAFSLFAGKEKDNAQNGADERRKIHRGKDGARHIDLGRGLIFLHDVLLSLGVKLKKSFIL